MQGGWAFYGRQEELGALLERMRAGRWFFGTIRGRRRIGKTALIQQALDTLKADGPTGRRTLLVHLPDSSPADVAAVFRTAVRESGLEAQAGGSRSIRGLPEVAAAVGSLCAAGTIVVLDEFQLCHQGPLRGLPSLLQMQVDRLQGRGNGVMPAMAALVTVENGNWGATSLRAIHAVLASAAEVLSEAFGRPPEAPIRVAPWRMAPQVFDDQRPYQVRLSARDRYWSQYVYQFSHELCHVMTNFDAHRGHKHRWFDESLCELASLFVLHRLADVWAEEPPDGIPDAAGFAPNHRTYARDMADRYPRIGRADHRDWLATHLAALEANRYERELTGAVAVLLLDMFQADPTLWRDCAHLNLWNPADDSTFADYLESWAAHSGAHGIEPRTPAAIGAALGAQADQKLGA